MIRKTIFLSVLFILAIGVLSVFADPQWEIKDRTNMVDENLEINQYLPFDPDSKIVRLNEESTLRLFDDLPYLDGATALYPVYSAFANAVYPFLEGNGAYYLKGDKHVLGHIICSKTAKAYERLINGEADLIFCTAPSDEQRAMAQEKGIILNLTPIGKEAFVFFVNKSNPVNNLTYSQIRDIYSGRITNWQELGKNINDAIIPYQRPKNSGSQTILELIMENDTIMEPLKENMIQSMGPMIEQVASYRNYANSIGYSFLFYTTEMTRNNKIKILSIDGVYPAKDTIKEGMYPFVQMFYAITVGNETENVNKFLKWILSEQGQYIIERTGYTPIR
jgi:phosphate transport system substrate-binding protein